MPCFNVFQFFSSLSSVIKFSINEAVSLLSLIQWREAETSGNNIWRVHFGGGGSWVVEAEDGTDWRHKWHGVKKMVFRARDEELRSINKIRSHSRDDFRFFVSNLFLLLLVAPLISQHHHSAPLLYPKKWSMATTFRNGDESTERMSSCVIKGCVCCLCFSSLFQVGYKYTHGRESQKTSMPLLPLLDEG